MNRIILIIILFLIVNVYAFNESIVVDLSKKKVQYLGNNKLCIYDNKGNLYNCITQYEIYENKKMKKEILLVLVLLSINVSAVGNITGIVCDYNTMNRLENVSVNLYLNGSLNTTTDTNVNGEFEFLDKDSSNYTITFTKVDYEGQTDDIELLDNTTEDLLIKLIPISYNAIIRLTFNDLGMNLNDMCVYYSNGRLQGCYTMNDTITLYEHQDYYIILKPKNIDIINNPVQAGITIMNYSENILRLVFMVIVLAIIVILFLKFFSKV